MVDYNVQLLTLDVIHNRYVLQSLLEKFSFSAPQCMQVCIVLSLYHSKHIDNHIRNVPKAHNSRSVHCDFIQCNKKG